VSKIVELNDVLTHEVPEDAKKVACVQDDLSKTYDFESKADIQVQIDVVVILDLVHSNLRIFPHFVLCSLMNHLLKWLFQFFHVDALVPFLESKALDQVEGFDVGGVRLYIEVCDWNESDEVEKEVGVDVPFYGHLYPTLWDLRALWIVVSYEILD
jgi:hypothetical protein